MLKRLLVSLSICATLFACNNNDKTVAKRDVLFENLDTTVSPGADFFEYANGGWIKKNPIPATDAAWDIGNLVNEETLNRLKEINEKAAKADASTGTAEQKIGDFWTTAMDSAKVEADGLKPLQPQLEKIAAANDVKSLIAVITEFKKIGSGTFFADFVSQDDKNSEMMTYKLWQGGIGLGEREYYFKNDSATINIRNEYIKYITSILTMTGDDATAAATAAKNILAFETKLAQLSRKLEELRDPYANYNKMAITDLSKLTSAIDWSAYLSATGVKSIDSVIVGQPEFFKNLGNVITTTPINDLKSYVKFNFISDMAAVLPDTFGITAFTFNKVFTGATKRKPRWKRVVQLENNLIGEMLGQLYVKEFFNEKAKKRYEDMVEAIRDALKDRISKLSWMGDSTKQKAFIKLTAIKKKVGYPDKWKDYSALKIGKESFAQNLMNANLWLHNYQINKLGKPVDKDEWGMSPQTYNAYYNPSLNEIVLPAGIFVVPGYRDEELDDAMVYGNGGASTIGHEITHGFDDEGRQFDAKGNLVSWWTKKDEEEFKKRAAVIIKQFDEYEPLPGYHINGKATTGENIADLGGILLGIEAFKKTEQYKKGETINGLTPMQRFFLGYSIGWLGHMKDEQLRNRLLTDVHSPAKYRVNGPFVNIDEFYSTFNIKPGDKMYRADSLRVKIW